MLDFMSRKNIIKGKKDRGKSGRKRGDQQKREES